MNKKNKTLNIIFIILNCIIVLLMANSRVVNRMPIAGIMNFNNIVGYTTIGNVNVPIYQELSKQYTFIDDAYELFLGRGFPTVIIALITVIISFIINKMIIKQDLKIKQYINLFLILLMVNIIAYRIGINIVV